MRYLTTCCAYYSSANGLSCDGVVNKGVRWTLTPANQTDVARCPLDTHGVCFIWLF